MRNIVWTLVVILFCAALVDAARAQELDLLQTGGLENWVKADGQPVDSPKWELGDGTLHLTSGGGGNIFFRDWVGDFILKFEWRISEKGNSGVKYRVQKYGDSWLGCEYQLQDDGTNSISKQSTASLYDVIEPSSAIRPNPVGEWNTAMIVASNNHIQHWMNAALVVSTTTGSWDWLTRVNNSKFNAHPGWGQNWTGRIMLQDHGSEVWFRNISLTRAENSVSNLRMHAPVLQNSCCPDPCGTAIPSPDNCRSTRTPLRRSITRSRRFGR